MTTITQSFLGRFDKAKAKTYAELLKSQGIDVQVLELSGQGASRFQLAVSYDTASSAAQLIKDYEFERSVVLEEKRKKAESRAIVWFLLFAIGFVGYVVLTYHHSY